MSIATVLIDVKIVHTDLVNLIKAGLLDDYLVYFIKYDPTAEYASSHKKDLDHRLLATTLKVNQNQCKLA